MKYESHSDFCQMLAELGFLKASHNPCLVSDRCVAEEEEEIHGEG